MEYISKGKPPFVFARKLGEGTFDMHENMQLGSVLIKPTISQPRALTADGSPDLTVYAFYLRTASDKSRLEVGSVVELQAVKHIN